MTDADLRRLIEHPLATTPDGIATLAREVLSLRAEVARLNGVIQADIADLTACRYDLGVCADKLATASAHLGIVAQREPQRFWTRTPPSAPGWHWWRNPDVAGEKHPTMIRVYQEDLNGIHIDGGYWSGPMTPPALVAPE